MKKFLVTLLLALSFILTGCGGGGGGSGSSTTSSSTNSSWSDEDVSGLAYNMWEYYLPNKTSSRSIDTLSIKNYQILDNNSFVETSSTYPDEKIIYNNLSDKIEVIFYKNDQLAYRYDLKKYVKIGDFTTVEKSGCILTNHYNSITLDGSTYNDVIEVTCGREKGYYAKGYGEVYQASR